MPRQDHPSEYYPVKPDSYQSAWIMATDTGTFEFWRQLCRQLDEVKGRGLTASAGRARSAHRYDFRRGSEVAGSRRITGFHNNDNSERSEVPTRVPFELGWLP